MVWTHICVLDTLLTITLIDLTMPMWLSLLLLPGTHTAGGAGKVFQGRDLSCDFTWLTRQTGEKAGNSGWLTSRPVPNMTTGPPETRCNTTQKYHEKGLHQEQHVSYLLSAVTREEVIKAK